MSADLVRFARLALDSIERRYPYHLVHLLRHEGDVREPRDLYPVFHGAYDWHSAVHGHWCVARALRLARDAAFDAEAWPVLVRRLDPEALGGELDYLADPARAGFERPYGLAWLLQLGAELREWREPRLAAAGAALAPLEAVAAERLLSGFSRQPFPVRSGEHSQTAFAMGLALDWARGAGESGVAEALAGEARRLYLRDEHAPLHLEPSGQDFLSPALGEADLMRRVLPRDEFAGWLSGWLPGGAGAGVLPLHPVTSPDLADGKLSHLAGLNLSRAWMLEGVAAALAPTHPRRPALAHAAAEHREAGLAAVSDGPYTATHWLGSFAAYLVTGRGLPASA